MRLAFMALIKYSHGLNALSLGRSLGNVSLKLIFLGFKAVKRGHFAILRPFRGVHANLWFGLLGQRGFLH